MTVWAKLLSFLFTAPGSVSRLPEEAHLDHTIRNFHSVMQGAQHLAHQITDREKNNPKRAELKTIRDRSTTTIDALVREMQGRR